jgi:hypothetical protein
MILRERQYEQCLDPKDLGQFTGQQFPKIIVAADSHRLTIPQYTEDSLSLVTQFLV